MAMVCGFGNGANTCQRRNGHPDDRFDGRRQRHHHRHPRRPAAASTLTVAENTVRAQVLFNSATQTAAGAATSWPPRRRRLATITANVPPAPDPFAVTVSSPVSVATVQSNIGMNAANPATEPTSAVWNSTIGSCSQQRPLLRHGAGLGERSPPRSAATRHQHHHAGRHPRLLQQWRGRDPVQTNTGSGVLGAW